MHYPSYGDENSTLELPLAISPSAEPTLVDSRSLLVPIGFQNQNIACCMIMKSQIGMEEFFSQSTATSRKNKKYILIPDELDGVGTLDWWCLLAVDFQTNAIGVSRIQDHGKYQVFAPENFQREHNDVLRRYVFPANSVVWVVPVHFSDQNLFTFYIFDKTSLPNTNIMMELAKKLLYTALVGMFIFNFETKQFQFYSCEDIRKFQ